MVRFIDRSFERAGTAQGTTLLLGLAGRVAFLARAARPQSFRLKPVNPRLCSLRT
jgi:hypothetical protein